MTVFTCGQQASLATEIKLMRSQMDALRDDLDGVCRQLASVDLEVQQVKSAGAAQVLRAPPAQNGVNTKDSLSPQWCASMIQDLHREHAEQTEAQISTIQDAVKEHAKRMDERIKIIDQQLDVAFNSINTMPGRIQDKESSPPTVENQGTSQQGCHQQDASHSETPVNEMCNLKIRDSTMLEESSTVSEAAYSQGFQEKGTASIDAFEFNILRHRMDRLESWLQQKLAKKFTSQSSIADGSECTRSSGQGSQKSQPAPVATCVYQVSSRKVLSPNTSSRHW